MGSAVLVLLATSVQAQEWVPMAPNMYIDRQSIATVDGNIMVWVLQNNPDAAAHGEDFLSIVYLKEIDCHVKRFRKLQMVAFSGLRGQGEILAKFDPEEGWDFGVPGNYDFVLTRALCDLQKKIRNKGEE
jgi:hypothetical protein